MTTNILDLSALDLFQKIQTKELSSTEITQAFLHQAKETNPVLQSFVTLTDKLALSMAAKVDQKISHGEGLALLEGVPIALKDNLCLKDYPTTCSSKILESFIPPYNGTVVNKILERNMPIIGKTNLDEFAMGSSTENSYFNTSKNPWDIARVPGGSSGGSAIAVSARQAPLSLGSDTGGSIRQPASFCGVVGMKPTYGLVSRYGLVAFASSLDQIGPFAGNIADAAALLQVIGGHDHRDSTSQPVALPDLTTRRNAEKPIKVGIPAEFMNAEMDPQVKTFYTKLLNSLNEKNIIVEEVSLPSLEYALATYYIIAPAEASSNLSRYDGVRYGYRAAEAENLVEMMELSRSHGFGAEVKRRILIGTYVLSSGYYDAYYRKAMQVRTLIKQDFQKTFQDFDAVLSPTTPSPAFKIGGKSTPLEMYLSDVMTIPVNLAGLPALSLPCGKIENLPMGLQIITNTFDEQKLFDLAAILENHFNFKPISAFKGDSK